jgi:hypothetical protein
MSLARAIRIASLPLIKSIYSFKTTIKTALIVVISKYSLAITPLALMNQQYSIIKCLKPQQTPK